MDAFFGLTGPHTNADLVHADGVVGGAGKTFLYETLLATVCADGGIAISAAFSGMIAVGGGAHRALQIQNPSARLGCHQHLLRQQEWAFS